MTACLQMRCNISNTRDSVSLGYLNTEKSVQNTTHSEVFCAGTMINRKTFAFEKLNKFLICYDQVTRCSPCKETGSLNVPFLGFQLKDCLNQNARDQVKKRTQVDTLCSRKRLGNVWGCVYWHVSVNAWLNARESPWHAWGKLRGTQGGTHQVPSAIARDWI